MALEVKVPHRLSEDEILERLAQSFIESGQKNFTLVEGSYVKHGKLQHFIMQYQEAQYPGSVTIESDHVVFCLQVDMPYGTGWATKQFLSSRLSRILK